MTELTNKKYVTFNPMRSTITDKLNRIWDQSSDHVQMNRVDQTFMIQNNLWKQLKEIRIKYYTSVSPVIFKCIKNINFPSLRFLTLQCECESLEGICRIPMQLLIAITIQKNKIISVSDLRKLKCNYLSQIYLRQNKINQFDSLTELHSPQLRKFYGNGNQYQLWSMKLESKRLQIYGYNHDTYRANRIQKFGSDSKRDIMFRKKFTMSILMYNLYN